MTPIGTLERLVSGFDIFISYSRNDAVRYATNLAAALSARGFSCGLDQTHEAPGWRLPRKLRQTIGNSGMLIVLGTAASGQSEAIRREIEAFLPTGRMIYAMDLDGTLRQARWWVLLQSIPYMVDWRAASPRRLLSSIPDHGGEADWLPPFAPFSQTIDRIVTSIKFLPRRRLIARLATALGINPYDMYSARICAPTKSQAPVHEDGGVSTLCFETVAKTGAPLRRPSA